MLNFNRPKPAAACAWKLEPGHSQLDVAVLSISSQSFRVLTVCTYGVFASSHLLALVMLVNLDGSTYWIHEEPGTFSSCACWLDVF